MEKGIILHTGERRCRISIGRPANLDSHLVYTCTLLLILAALQVPAAGVDITAPTVISSSGMYTLRQDLLNRGESRIITIAASDVIFDGNGYTIDGLDQPSQYGIYVHITSQTVSNVTVRNLTVKDCYYGFFYYNTIGGLIENCTANSNVQHGIYLSMTDDSTVTGWNTSTNGNSGIFMDYSDNNTIERGSAYSNMNGVRISVVSNNNRLFDNRIYGNEYGINVTSSSGNIIYNNLLNNTVNAVPGNGNTWNTTGTAGAAINGGPTLGGNLWLLPDGSGFSSTTADRDDDGICDEPHALGGDAMDHLPLAAIPGQHTPLFAPEWPLRFLRPGDGGETAHPTAFYYLFDASTPEGKGDRPDTLRFVVKMLDGGLTLTADVSELDGNSTPLSPYFVRDTEYYFEHPFGDSSLGTVNGNTRNITIHARIGEFQNSTSGSSGSPPPLAVAVNPWIGPPGFTTTDLRDIEDFTAVEGFSVQRGVDTEMVGSIQFPGPLNFCDAAFADAMPSLWDHVRIEGNAIALDAAAPGLAILNASATLTMHAPAFTTTPGIFRDGEPDTYANGTPAAGSVASNVRWDNATKILRFDVPHWTRYHADGNGPEILVESPADGATFSSDRIALRGTASDPSGVSLVEVQVNGGDWTIADGTDAWNCTIPLAEGWNTIVVRATDRIGCINTIYLTLYRPAAPTATPTPTPPSPPEQPSQRSRSDRASQPVITRFVGNATLATTAWGEVLRTVTLTSEDGVVRLVIPSGTRILDADGKPVKELSVRTVCGKEITEPTSEPCMDRDVPQCPYRIGEPGLRFDPPLRMEILPAGEGSAWIWCNGNGAPGGCTELAGGEDMGEVRTEISRSGHVCIRANPRTASVVPTDDTAGSPTMTPTAPPAAAAQETRRAGPVMPLGGALGLCASLLAIGLRRARSR